MMGLKPYLFFIFIFGILLSISYVFSLSQNTCAIVSGATCGVGDYGLLSLTRDYNAQVYQYLDATQPYQLCCNYNGSTPYLTTSYCSHQPILSVYSLTNSHIAQNRTSPSSASYNLCATSFDGFTMCDYRPSDGACDADQTCVGSIHTPTPFNSHYGPCGPGAGSLGTNICCSFNRTITLQGIQIAQFEYWCGVEDGVCPEDYSNSTGGNPVCYPREDPDC